MDSHTNTDSQPPFQNLFKYYQKTSSNIKSSSETIFYTNSLTSLINDFYPQAEILSPRLRTPLKPGETVRILVNKIANLLDKNKIIGFETFDDSIKQGAQELANFDSYSTSRDTLNSNAKKKKKAKQPDACNLETINFLLENLKKRMPKSLKIYQQNYDLIKTQTWQPRYNIASFSSKLKTMQVTQILPQACIILSKKYVDILEPWLIKIVIDKKINKKRMEKSGLKLNNRKVGENGNTEKQEKENIEKKEQMFEQVMGQVLEQERVVILDKDIQGSSRIGLIESEETSHEGREFRPGPS